MAYTNEHVAELFDLVKGLPLGTCWDNGISLKTIGIQGATQEEVRAIRARFPGVFWAKEYDNELNWWRYKGTYRDWQIRIYACKEAPPTCRAITQTRKRVEKIPIFEGEPKYETREVEETVIVGWDCSGDHEEAGHEAQKAQ